MTYPRLIVGWKEWVSLPDIDIPAIQAKIDTGAQTSSLHAYQIKPFVRNGEHFVRFRVHPIRRDRIIIRQCEAPLIDTRIVKSSSGEKEERPVIKTILNIDGRGWEIELNLTNRDYMGFRMLIGREALKKYAMVHPGASYLHGKIPDENIKKEYLG